MRGALLVALFALPAPSSVRGDEPKLAPLAKPEEAAPKLPAAIPEAFAKLLEPRGARLTGADGKPVCDLWICREVALAAKPTTEMRVKQPTLPFGTLIGALQVTGPMTDYRNQAIAPGCYGLRVGWQPDNGNHLGTSDSRDFAVVTAFTHDKDPAPVGKLDDLVKLSLPAAPGEHVLALYVAVPEGDPPKDGAVRLFQRAGREEWAADLTLTGKAEGATTPVKLRLGLVLVGHVSE
jgi:hypothetical protein